MHRLDMGHYNEELHETMQAEMRRRVAGVPPGLDEVIRSPEGSDAGSFGSMESDDEVMPLDKLRSRLTANATLAALSTEVDLENAAGAETWFTNSKSRTQTAPSPGSQGGSSHSGSASDVASQPRSGAQPKSRALEGHRPRRASVSNLSNLSGLSGIPRSDGTFFSDLGSINETITLDGSQLGEGDGDEDIGFTKRGAHLTDCFSEGSSDVSRASSVHHPPPARPFTGSRIGRALVTQKHLESEEIESV